MKKPFLNVEIAHFYKSAMSRPLKHLHTLFPNMSELHIDGIDVPESYLNIDEYDTTDTGPYNSKLRTLTITTYRWEHGFKNSIKYLQQIANIESLDLRACTARSFDIDESIRLNNLRKFKINLWEIPLGSYAGIYPFKIPFDYDCNQLKELTVYNYCPKLHDQVINFIVQHPNLEKLSFSEHRVELIAKGRNEITMTIKKLAKFTLLCRLHTILLTYQMI